MTKQFLEFIYKYHYQLTRLNDYNVVKVVLGNQSCDLDSSVCALVYAYYLSMTEPNADDRKVSVIPALNILQDELPVKTEVCYFLKLNNIPLKKLVCRDTINLEELKAQNKLQLILVDHHVLSAADASLASAVVEIIDHRPLDPSVSWNNVNITMERVGSCASLIGRKILKENFGSSSRTVAQLLAGPIILDTANFSEAMGTTTEVDKQVFAKLTELWDDLIAPAELFKQLLHAKEDVSALTSEQILRKDLKVAGSIPIAGFPFLLQDLIAGRIVFKNFVQAVASLGAVNKSKIVILLGLRAGKEAASKIERDLGVYSTDASVAAKLIEHLKLETSLLQLAPVSNENSDMKDISVFQVLNTKASRKAVLPLIMDFQNKYSDILSS